MRTHPLRLELIKIAPIDMVFRIQFLVLLAVPFLGATCIEMHGRLGTNTSSKSVEEHHFQHRTREEGETSGVVRTLIGTETLYTIACAPSVSEMPRETISTNHAKIAVAGRHSAGAVRNFFLAAVAPVAIDE